MEFELDIDELDLCTFVRNREGPVAYGTCCGRVAVDAGLDGQIRIRGIELWEPGFRRWIKDLIREDYLATRAYLETEPLFLQAVQERVADARASKEDDYDEFAEEHP